MFSEGRFQHPDALQQPDRATEALRQICRTDPEGERDVIGPQPRSDEHRADDAAHGTTQRNPSRRGAVGIFLPQGGR